MTEPVKSTNKVNSENPFSSTGFEFCQPASATKSGDRRSTIRRKFIPIQPLKFTLGDFQECPNQLTKKPTKCQSRKELFKISTDKHISEKTGSTTGFVKDENGQFCMVPLKLPEFCQPVSTRKSSEKKNTIRRKFIPIQPLKFTLADFQESPKQPMKKPKVDCQIRKELFKVPQKKSDKRFSRYGNRRSQVNKTKLNDVKTVTSTQMENGTPLIDLDEADKLLTQSRLRPQLTKTVLFPLNSKTNTNNTPKKTPLARIDGTPTNNESMKEELEFLQLEKTLASATKVGTNLCSPMTSVCELLENAKLASPSRKSKDQNGILNNILTMVKEDKEEFDALRQHFAKYQDEHEKRMNAITKLIEENLDDKENRNTKRRSIRIASKTMKTKFVISPAISQKVDLRKNTLNKNLSMTFQFESPRTKSAINMYNTFRSDCSVLCTPKLERANAELPPNNATRSLSRRIQKQCLLLQDTPRPKSQS